jgi:LmbE family N-acetylglucosaminyl deacetylase
MPDCLLAFAPHPDDAEFAAGGTLAHYARSGWDVHMLIATDGRKGSFHFTESDLPDLRREEARRACLVLGAQSPIFLPFGDLELDSLAPGELRESCIRWIRTLQPRLVVAQDAFGLPDPHPDHRALAMAVSDALGMSFLPLVHPEHAQAGWAPHFVVEKLFHGAHPVQVNHVQDIRDTLAVKIASISEHRTQVEFLVEDVVRQARQAGLDLASVLGEGELDPLGALAWAVEKEAAAAGRLAGVPYAEVFRKTRFHPMIENLLTLEADGRSRPANSSKA